MNNTLTTIAFSMYSNKGVYALLLGSGISKSAGIPTGWDVTIDLIRKLAAQNGETDDESKKCLPVSISVKNNTVSSGLGVLAKSVTAWKDVDVPDNIADNMRIGT